MKDKTIVRDIVIGADENGVPVVTASPTRIRAKRNNWIDWRVRNRSGKAINVSVENFIHVESNRKVKPLEMKHANTTPFRSVAIITGKVKALEKHDCGRYKYDIHIDGNLADDPMLEIDS